MYLRSYRLRIYFALFFLAAFPQRAIGQATTISAEIYIPSFGQGPVHSIEPVDFVNPGIYTSTIGKGVLFSIEPISRAQPELSYSASGLPSGVTIDERTGIVSGTPTEIGTYDVTISARDGSGQITDITYTWNVVDTGMEQPNNPPVLVNPGSQTHIVGDDIRLSLVATDFDADAVTLAADNLPTGLSLHSATQVISGTATAPGTYQVLLSAADGRGGTDSTEFSWMISPARATVSITRTSNSATAVESDGSPITMQLERSHANGELSVDVAIIGTGEADLASVSGSDIAIRDGNNVVVTDSLTFPAGEAIMTFTIEATSDSQVEVPEVAYLAIAESANYTVNNHASRVRFAVRDNHPEVTTGSQLFVAQFTPENDAITMGSGIATLRLANDNSFGLLSLSFNGLTSQETASHIHIANPDSGPIAFSIPLGQISDERWNVEAAHHLRTNQAMLDKLLAAELYVNVHSTKYPGGEIRGTFLPVNGSIDMQRPPEPEEIQPLSGFDLDRDIARFLTQATFGPTSESVDELRARVASHGNDRIAAYSEWLDEQMSLSSPSAYEFYQAFNAQYRENATDETVSNNHIGITEGWFTSSVYSKAQLRERIGFALSEIFVVSLADGGLRKSAQGPASYYDMLRRGAFGTYKDLLRDVSTHPAMGLYLSHLRNQAELRNAAGEIIASPDENYAREVMQLFSIGLLHIHPDGSLKLDANGLPQRTYTQSDITELSRVFTGWGFSVASPDEGLTESVEENLDFTFNGYKRSTATYQVYFAQAMKMFEDNGAIPGTAGYIRYHDNNAKRILSTDIPAGYTGEEDLENALNILASHPNSAPFISRRLIQRLVTSNPSPGYLYRVASVFEQSGGDLNQVVRAILLDPEARNLPLGDGTDARKQKEPLIHFTAMLRLLDIKSEVAVSYPLTSLVPFGLPVTEVSKYEEDVNLVLIGWSRFGNYQNGQTFHQSPLYSPTVFNWFLPDYAPPGTISGAGLVAPEFQLITEQQIMRYYNMFYKLIIRSNLSLGGPTLQLEFVDTAFELPPWLIDTYMTAMDSNSDGMMNQDDLAFADPQRAMDASLALVNTLDLYLCSGRLQSQSYASADIDPRAIITQGVYDALRKFDNRTPEDAVTARDERIKEALYLVGTAPGCLIQK